MDRFEITFEGVPKPLKRHRTSGKRTYDPSQEEKHALLYQYFAKPMEERLQEPMEGPLRLSLAFGFPFPKSTPKKLLNSKNIQYKTTKPDLTNLIKLVEDSFNGILWKDDSHIVEIGCSKFLSAKGITHLALTKVPIVL